MPNPSGAGRGSEWGVVADQDNLDAIEVALESGVTFFDTADVYGGGHSEELLGRAMQNRREAFVVATKIGWIDFDGRANCSQYDSDKGTRAHAGPTPLVTRDSMSPSASPPRAPSHLRGKGVRIAGSSDPAIAPDPP